MLPMMLMMTAAFAQEVAFEETNKAIEEAEAPEADLSAELGGAMTTGNTDFWTVKGTVTGSYRWQMNKLGMSAMGLTGRNRPDVDGDGILNNGERDLDRVKNAQKFDGGLRYDRFLGESSSLYAMSSAMHDYFAGVQLRTNEQVGYSRNLLKAENTSLLVELGAGVQQEWQILEDPAAEDFSNVFQARALIAFSHTFNDAVKFTESVEAYENVLDPADFRAVNRAALTMQLSENLALKLSNDLYWDNTPVDGFQKLDQTTMLSVVATIL
ncbi:MAG: DUF481 domain-containing protein [Myxococcota bacterium]|nr:DUF481 domain-containing protein [Myxococcota bacterium]